MRLEFGFLSLSPDLSPGLFQACSAFPEGPAPEKPLPGPATSPIKAFGCPKLGPHVPPLLKPSPGLSSSLRNP